MRSFRGGICLGAAAVVAVIASLSASVTSASAAGSAFGVKEFLAATCTVETCNKESELSELFTQAAAHPNYGITDFTLDAAGKAGEEVPTKLIKNLRVDLPAGLSVNPEAVPQCSEEAFTSTEVEEGVFLPSNCNESGAESTVLGVDKVVVAVEPVKGVFADVPLEGTVYNLVQPKGVPAEFGVALNLSPLGYTGLYAHTLLEGGVSWHMEVGIDKEVIPTSGDYHEYFKINDINSKLPLLSSRLIYEGRVGTGFLTTPSVCNVDQTTRLEAESYEGEVATTQFTTPIGATGCSQVPFSPTIKVTPSTTQPDAPNGVAVSVELPQNENSEAINSSTLQTSEVTLPEGMAFNPSAANGLEACSDAQFGRGTGQAVACPAGSVIGNVAIETPTLPAGSLKGDVYVGTPLSNTPSSGDEYRIFINAESARYGVSVQLEGKVKVNESTGRLTTLVAENPQTPFSKFTFTLSNGNHTPLANPLVCGATSTATFIPYTGIVSVTATDPFTVGCTTPPFSLGQAVKSLPTSAGSSTTFTLGITRGDGNQYLKKVSATLPAGFVAKIPSVTQCGEPAARNGACSAASEVGSVETSVGSGPSPYVLKGTAYLTGPYDGAPFGLSIVVPATKVGPYDYGNIVTQAGISINPYNARVTVAGEVPTIVGGVPLRMKALTITINHGNFMLNPTNCSPLATETTFTSTMGATDSVSTPFQATGCSSLGFKPKFSYSTNGNPTKRYGARLDVKLTETAGNANIKSVKVQLPLKLPSRQSTLALACAEKTFAAEPYKCPSGSNVGGVTIKTPTLPDTLTGPAYFVSHGGAAFPDLDLVAKGDGVTVILVGKTNISKGITHTTFESLPDVPVSSFELHLPTGEKSALGVNGNLCQGKMYMPTTVVGQNGKSVTEKIQIQVAECPVRIVGHKVKGNAATVTAAVSSAGKLSTSGKDLLVIHKKIGKAVGNAKIDVKLSRLGKRILASKHRLTVRVRVGFKSSTGAKRESQAFAKLVFKS